MTLKWGTFVAKMIYKYEVDKKGVPVYFLSNNRVILIGF